MRRYRKCVMQRDVVEVVVWLPVNRCKGQVEYSGQGEEVIPTFIVQKSKHAQHEPLSKLHHG